MVRRLIFTFLIGLLGCFAASAQIDVPRTDSASAIGDAQLLWLFDIPTNALVGQSAS